MVWTRTISGLRNFGKFTRRKYTVFCEGGDASIAPQDALNGGGVESSEDAAFWRAIFHWGKKEVHIKSIGSCTSIDAMCDIIIRNNIPNVIACRDRDWLMSHEMRKDRRIIYTYGYSWENDAVTPATVAATLCSIGLLSLAERATFSPKFKDLYDEIDRKCRWPLKLQIQSRKNDYAAVPTNKLLGGVIRVNKQEGIVIDTKYWISLLKRNKLKFCKHDNGKKVSDISARDIPGHAIMGLAVEFARAELGTKGRRFGDREFTTALLTHMGNAVDDLIERNVLNYYSHALAKI